MTYKTKNNILISGIFIVLLLSYKLAIHKTFELKKEYADLVAKNAVKTNASVELAKLYSTEKYYDSLLQNHNLYKTSLQNSMLKTLNTFSDKHHLKVIKFSEPHIFQENNLTHKTFSFTLKGDYNALVTFVHHLEQKCKYGEIINLQFKKIKDYKTNVNYLQLHVLLKHTTSN